MFHSRNYKAVRETMRQMAENKHDTNANRKLWQERLEAIDDPSVRLLIRFINRNSHHYNNFHTTLRRCTGLDIRPIVFMLPTKNGEINVYKHIRIQNVMIDANWNFLQTYDFLVNTFRTIKADREDPKKAKPWDGHKRTIRRLLRSEVLSTGKMLQNFTNATERISTQYGKYEIDNHINKLATTLREELKPVELQFAETPEDIFAMYEGGISSCMVSTGRDIQWTWFKKDHKIGPSAFYVYTGHAKGAYLTRNGQVVARCIVYKQKDNSWKYGRLYAATPTWSTKFQELMNQARIGPLRDAHKCWDHGFNWRAPAFKNTRDGQYYTPVPYFDNLPSGPLRSVFVPAKDKEEPYFEMSVNIGKGNISTQQTVGLINQAATLQCTKCERRMQGMANVVFPMDGHGVYCSPACANGNDYWGCQRSDGITVWLHIDQTFRTVDGGYYTNSDAARKLGAKALITEPDTAPEDPDYMATGAVFRIGEQQWSHWNANLALLNWLKSKPKQFSKLTVIATKVRRNVTQDLGKLLELDRPFDFPDEIITEFAAKLAGEYDFNTRSMQILLTGGIIATDHFINTSRTQGLEL